jgi:putative oxygen-independent coproporphyrinogen III oxidase
MKKTDSAPGLYVHVPFCKTKCPYCDFHSIVSGTSPAAWLGALEREAALYRGSFGGFDTLYLGGGTPSFLGEDEIERLVAAIRGAFDFAPDSEVTIEVNPDDVTAGKLARWRALGFNRVSLGVQSFNDDELSFLGRRHDAAAARRAIVLARDAGFDDLGCDLIYGFEGHRPASWRRTLDEAVSLVPEHLSCYQMTLEHSTEFGRMVGRGEMTQLGEEPQRSFFLETSRLLTDAGYIHYEISNFSRGEAYVSRHNHKYWRHVPYLGLGPSAHSFHDGRRWWNVRSVDGYVEALARGESPVEGDETLGEDDLALETLYLGFRTREGVALEDLRRYPNWRAVLESLVSESLVTLTGDRARPTLEGFLVADRLPLVFVA